MPELPEVETTRRGIEPHIQDQQISDILIRHHRLRWPINIPTQKLKGQTIRTIHRRAKYLLLNCDNGTLIIHLGMSGRLRVLKKNVPPQKHDHVDIAFTNHKILRYTDPRRFGAVLWTEENPYHHPLLTHLGYEPLEKEFSSEYLWERAQKSKMPIKSFIMDNKIVVGVGNIYATEALFLAGIYPKMPAYHLNKKSAVALVKIIKTILKEAIKSGGTTLRDFLKSDGKPGYFATYLQVYGREGLPCFQCHTVLQGMRIGQRSTVYCECCQKNHYKKVMSTL